MDMAVSQDGQSADRIIVEFAKSQAQSPVPTQFIENLRTAVWASDAMGRVLWFNARAADLWGREPVGGDPGDQFWGIPQTDRGRGVLGFESPLATVLRSGLPMHGVEGVIDRPDGSRRWVLQQIEPVRDHTGQIVGALTSFLDNTAQHEALELLKAQERRLEATFQHAGSGIAEVDAEGHLLRVNNRLCELLGRSAAEIIGRSIFDAELAESTSEDVTQFRLQVGGELDRYGLEKRMRRSDGSWFWAEVTSSSVRDAEGRFLYAVRVQNDITDRALAREELARRAEEQAALHDFIEQQQHAHGLSDLYEPALDAIQRALRCERAAILLLDDHDVMRFAAWRGLSQGYRNAVEGHSPWTRDSSPLAPVCINDVAAATDLAGTLKQVVGAEGIAAIAFIPLQASGRLIGKFMAYYDRPHDFSMRQIEVAQAIARQLGFSIERIQAQKSAQQLVAIVESSHDAIVSKDLNGIIRTWNRGAERLFGYRAEEVVGKPILILIPPDHLDEEPAILARIRRGELVDHFETVRRRKDGARIDISLTISPVRDAKGEIVGASKVARDISERKLTEAKLKDNERRLQELLAAIPAAIYTTDAAGRVTYFNEAAVALAGRQPQLGVDEWCVSWKLLHPDGRPMPLTECPMAIALKEGRPIRGIEAVLERPDGTRVPFIPYPTPLRDAEGKLVGAINMLVDISERKQAETQQRILLNELNHRVKNNMQMLQSLLYTSARQSRSNEARQVLDEACRRVAAMSAAQRVLYDTTDAVHFNAADFINAVCQTVQQTFPADVTVECSAVAVELSNDIAMPLALILNELLTNAVKYGAQGGQTVRVGLDRQDGRFVLSVADEGAGFDLDAVRETASGLKLVQGLARQLRADFRVERKPVSRCSLIFN